MKKIFILFSFMVIFGILGTRLSAGEDGKLQDRKINVNKTFKNTKLKKIIKFLSKKTKVKFEFDKDIEDFKINLEIKRGESLKEILKPLEDCDIYFNEYDNKISVLRVLIERYVEEKIDEQDKYKIN